jgi:hypothetical protein
MNGMTRPAGAPPRIRLVQAPKDGSRVRGRYSDVPLSAVLKLSSHITEELAPEIKRRLDGAFTAALHIKNSVKKQNARRALGALRQAAEKHRRHIESTKDLGEFALPDEKDLIFEASNEGGDPKALARSLFRRDCEAVGRHARHVAKVCRESDSQQPASSKTQGLNALSKAASNHRRHLSNQEAEVREILTFSYEQDIYQQGSHADDSKSPADVRAAVKRLARHIVRACRQWDRIRPTNLLVPVEGKMTAIEKILPTSGRSKPEDCIIADVIYNVWTDVLGRSPIVEKSSPFAKFAYDVFRLYGEKVQKGDVIRKRLTNPCYERFQRVAQVHRKI